MPAERFPESGHERKVVHLHAVGVLSAEAAVKKRALVVVHRSRLAGPTEDVPCELHHIVATAAFFRRLAELIRKLARIALPALAVARASGAIGALCNDLVPEIIRDVMVALVAGQFVTASRTDYFGNIGVGMQSLELIFAFGEGVEELLMFKASSQSEVLLLSGEGVQVEKGFVHPPVLDHLHLGPLFITNRI